MDSEEKIRQKKASRRRFFKGLALVTGASVAAYADARYIEPGYIEVSHHTAYLPDLPLALDGFAIAQLSDIHYGPVTPEKTIREAIALAMREKPHLVALTGDFVNREVSEAERLAPLLKPLAAAPFGMVGCLGNHDYKSGGNPITQTLERAGVVMLRNQSKLLASGLYVVGIEDTHNGHPDADKAFAGVPESAASVFLTHNPTGIFGAASRKCVALSGHTHGGQIRVPGFAPRNAADMEGFPMVEGWGKFDKSRLFISRGVGMMHQPFRFLCRPEVAIIVLKRGDKKPTTKRNLAERAVGAAEEGAIKLFHKLAR
ncbi:MAG: metallophosphoesterase [Armatimonadetes bacterium]|nr:metallophosphoesterase [Armatimonadota bacterium]